MQLRILKRKDGTEVLQYQRWYRLEVIGEKHIYIPEFGEWTDVEEVQEE